MENEITKARTFAKAAHAGQKYGNSADYFEGHVMKVANRVFSDIDATEAHMAVAYLHDVVEDTYVTIENLIAMGFSEEVTDAVDLMSRKADETYIEYIEKVAANPDSLAWLVKYHDLNENYANTLKGGKASKIKRYEAALEIMTGVAA